MKPLRYITIHKNFQQVGCYRPHVLSFEGSGPVEFCEVVFQEQDTGFSAVTIHREEEQVHHHDFEWIRRNNSLGSLWHPFVLLAAGAISAIFLDDLHKRVVHVMHVQTVLNAVSVVVGFLVVRVHNGHHFTPRRDDTSLQMHMGHVRPTGVFLHARRSLQVP